MVKNNVISHHQSQFIAQPIARYFCGDSLLCMCVSRVPSFVQNAQSALQLPPHSCEGLTVPFPAATGRPTHDSTALRHRARGMSWGHGVKMTRSPSDSCLV